MPPKRARPANKRGRSDVTPSSRANLHQIADPFFLSQRFSQLEDVVATDADAAFNLGLLYETDNLGFASKVLEYRGGARAAEGRYALAGKYYAAAPGHERAVANLANLFVNKRVAGVDMDGWDAAVHVLKGAVGNEESWALFQLGVLHDTAGENRWAAPMTRGRGLWAAKKNDRKAMGFYRRAVAKLHPGALNNAGKMLGEGRGCKRDDRASLTCYCLAAERGSVEALKNIAGLYEQGIILEKDEAEAKKLYLLSVKKNWHFHRGDVRLGNEFSSGDETDEAPGAALEARNDGILAVPVTPLVEDKQAPGGVNAKNVDACAPAPPAVRVPASTPTSKSIDCDACPRQTCSSVPARASESKSKCGRDLAKAAQPHPVPREHAVDAEDIIDLDTDCEDVKQEEKIASVSSFAISPVTPSVRVAKSYRSAVTPVPPPPPCPPAEEVIDLEKETVDMMNVDVKDEEPTPRPFFSNLPLTPCARSIRDPKRQSQSSELFTAFAVGILNDKGVPCDLEYAPLLNFLSMRNSVVNSKPHASRVEPTWFFCGDLPVVADHRSLLLCSREQAERAGLLLAQVRSEGLPGFLFCDAESELYRTAVARLPEIEFASFCNNLQKLAGEQRNASMKEDEKCSKELLMRSKACTDVIKRVKLARSQLAPSVSISQVP